MTELSNARQIASLAENIKSVTDFGAVGDGVTDDTAAINAALTSGAGSSVYFPAGDYLISDALDIQSNTDIFGDGRQSRVLTGISIVNGGAGIGQVMLDGATVSQFTIRNMQFDNTAMTDFLAGVRCISLIACTDFYISNVYTTGPGAAVAAIGCSNYEISNCYHTVVSTDAAAHHDGIYDQWGGSHDFNIVNNVVDGVGIGKYGVLVTGEATGGAASACYNFNISTNKVKALTVQGIRVNGRSGENYSFRIGGNHVEDITGFMGISAADSYEFVINDNIIDTTEFQGIRVDQETGEGTLGVKDGIITGNIVKDANQNGSVNEASGSGITVDDTALNIIVSNNRIIGSAHVHGIYLSASSQDCTVSSNNIDAGTDTDIDDNGTDNRISYLASNGTYIPTLVDEANVTSSTASLCRWTRDVDIVSISGRVSVVATAGASAITKLGISLPTASDFTSVANDASGVAATTGALSSAIFADITNDRLTLQFPAPDTVNKIFYFNAQYTVS